MIFEKRDDETRFWDILLSTNKQLECLTLLGIILNGLMQGYVTSNTVYVFLIENIEDKLLASCGLKTDNTEIPSDNRLYEYHADRIHSTLESIAGYKRRQLKIEHQSRKIKSTNSKK